MRRPQGTGSIFRMASSTVLWIKYHHNGKSIRESAHTTKVKEAERLLRGRLAAIATGTYVGLRLERVRIAELADDLIREYRINGRKSIDDVQARWDLHLKPFFGTLRAAKRPVSLWLSISTPGSRKALRMPRSIENWPHSSACSTLRGSRLHPRSTSCPTSQCSANTTFEPAFSNPGSMTALLPKPGRSAFGSARCLKLATPMAGDTKSC